MIALISINVLQVSWTGGFHPLWCLIVWAWAWFKAHFIFVLACGVTLSIFQRASSQSPDLHSGLDPPWDGSKVLKGLAIALLINVHDLWFVQWSSPSLESGIETWLGGSCANGWQRVVEETFVCIEPERGLRRPVGTSWSWSGILFTWILSIIAVLICSIFAASRFMGLKKERLFACLVWPTDLTASSTKTVVITFNSLSMDVQQIIDRFTAAARCEDQSVSAFVSPGPGFNQLHLVFSAKQSGRYQIHLKYNNHFIKGFPAYVIIQPGPIDPMATIIGGMKSQMIVLTGHEPKSIFVRPKDSFCNAIPPDRLADLANDFGIKLTAKLGDESVNLKTIHIKNVIYHVDSSDALESILAFSPGHEGWYKAALTYKDQIIPKSELTLLVLTVKEMADVNRFMESPHNIPTFKGEIVAQHGINLSRPRLFYLTLNTRQLVLKEYFLGLIPLRLCAFRLMPSTKLSLVAYKKKSIPVIRIQDGFQGHPEVVLKEGNVVAALFHLLLLKKIGGSESFQDKANFFYDHLLRYYKKKGYTHRRLPLIIQRDDILQSSLRATKFFTDSDWCRLFEIEFMGEPGMDLGGLRREWLEIVCQKLFHPQFGLFTNLEENSEAVYPNPNATKAQSHLFKFAGKIVGKCLYECAQGKSYRQQLPIRLTRSFLAQIVEMRVEFRHFADDAPELYASKISFIQNNVIDSMDLNLKFIDEEIDPQTKSVRVVELKPGGNEIPVKEKNKLEYLDLLAQHRLARRIKDQTQQFLSGLHQLIPDSLLTLFDESELELLLCGCRHYDLNDLKLNHIVIRTGPSSVTMQWFWAALKNFTPEQFERLVQFITGSSRLPPGGFGELKPLIQISSNGSRGGLPTAQTCFNVIALSEHASYKEFEQALFVALYEGNEGFGLV
eukprot:TCALIF_11033-PA protein Name:"Similar to AREL1 Apoptosis-resistant E3 ubiquitin protein ligase 1 (Homo sapiens)" AED:0.25 eAED:0.25 QI:0/0/0/0.5/1/1/2/0/895